MHEIKLVGTFGPRLRDGSEAYSFRVSAIDPYFNMPTCDRIVLDFSGIRNANSSFVNALVTGLFEQHGSGALSKITFRGCLPSIQVLIQSAADLGMMDPVNRV